MVATGEIFIKSVVTTSVVTTNAQGDAGASGVVVTVTVGGAGVSVSVGGGGWVSVGGGLVGEAVSVLVTVGVGVADGCSITMKVAVGPVTGSVLVATLGTLINFPDWMYVEPPRQLARWSSPIVTRKRWLMLNRVSPGCTL
jgi:hypothetical protein